MTVSVSEGPPFRLLVTSYGRTEIAGPRVLRGAPHPDIQWSHDTRTAAEKYATALANYFDATNRTRKISKRALRTFGE